MKEHADVENKNNRLLLRNEFACVEVVKDETANGPRLLIRDLEDGAEVYLDLLEVESLTKMTHDDFTQWVKPE